MLNDEPAFLFTTENLGAIDLLTPVGARVLAVCAGGGDPIFCMVESGAQQIDIFDISINAKYIMELKLAALKNLSFSDFRKLFNINKKDEYGGNLNFAIYDEISDFLYPDCRQVFDLIKNRQINIGNIIEQKAAYRTYGTYVSDIEKYNRLKSSLADFKINFYHTSLSALPAKLIRLYDIIYLSNIHIKSAFKDRDKVKEDIKKIAKFLRPSGVIFANYIYNYCAMDEYYKLTDEKYDLSIFYSTFSEFDYQVHYVTPNKYEMAQAKIDDAKFLPKLSRIKKGVSPIKIQDQVHLLKKMPSSALHKKVFWTLKNIFRRG